MGPYWNNILNDQWKNRPQAIIFEKDNCCCFAKAFALFTLNRVISLDQEVQSMPIFNIQIQHRHMVMLIQSKATSVSNQK